MGLTELGFWLDGKMAHLAARMPPPPFAGPLSQVERTLADDILTRRAPELRRTQDQYRAASRKARRPPAAQEQALDALGALAAEMIGSLRARLACLPSDRPLLSLVARLDAQLPTDALEYMDDPRLDGRKREAVVAALDRVTRHAGDFHLLARLLEPLYGPPAASPTTVLDLASGAGGFPVALAKIAGRPRNLRIIASDLDQAFLEQGRQLAERNGVAELLRFLPLDALTLPREVLGEPVDIVTCTRALHHFGPEATTRMLTRALGCARRGVVFVDISRSISRMFMAAWAGVVSGNWRFAHDAVVSVRKAFTAQEMRLISACVPGGEGLETFYAAPGYVVVRGAKAGPTRRGS